MAIQAEVTSSFQQRPCYRYIRAADRMPRYAEVSGKPFDKILCRVRLFNPTGAGTWWIAAYDAEDEIAWGAAELQEIEVGSISMRELPEFRGQFGLPIERDLHYRPTSLEAIIAAGRHAVKQS